MNNKNKLSIMVFLGIFLSGSQIIKTSQASDQAMQNLSELLEQLKQHSREFETKCDRLQKECMSQSITIAQQNSKITELRALLIFERGKTGNLDSQNKELRAKLDTVMLEQNNLQRLREQEVSKKAIIIQGKIDRYLLETTENKKRKTVQYEELAARLDLALSSYCFARLS